MCLAPEIARCETLFKLDMDRSVRAVAIVRASLFCSNLSPELNSVAGLEWSSWIYGAGEFQPAIPRYRVRDSSGVCGHHGNIGAGQIIQDPTHSSGNTFNLFFLSEQLQSVLDLGKGG